MSARAGGGASAKALTIAKNANPFVNLDLMNTSPGRRTPQIYANRPPTADPREEYANFSVVAYPAPRVRLRCTGLDRTVARGEESVERHRALISNGSAQGHGWKY